MSLLSKTELRRKLLALATFAAVSAVCAAPALADHGHHGGGVWFPPIPRVFVPFPPPLVVVAAPYGHGCDYDDHHHSYYGGYGHGYRGHDYAGRRHYGGERYYGRGGHGHGHGHRRGHGH